MESCFLPIEVCEKVMNALLDEMEDFDNDWTFMPQRVALESQQTLYACALTCRAWRARAQYLLWTFPVLPKMRCLGFFQRVISKSPANIALIRGIVLASRSFKDGVLCLHAAGELFMQSLPNLQHMVCFDMSFDVGPPLRLLRMRLPFFSTITILSLWGCTFESARGMLDLVWACSNLATLAIGKPKINSKCLDAAGMRNLSAAAENVRACQKLTRLYLDAKTVKILCDPANIGLVSVGGVFGYAVTELRFDAKSTPEAFISLFRDSLPALRSVAVSFKGLDDSLEIPSWLHVILATGRPIPGILKTIILECNHSWYGHGCCENAVGKGEEVVGSALRLPELLEELVIRIDDCNRPERHAAYIWDVLPGMRNVLRFEYRPDDEEVDWKPYTVIPQNVPWLLYRSDTRLDSDSDSDSDSGSHIDRDNDCDAIPSKPRLRLQIPFRR